MIFASKRAMKPSGLGWTGEIPADWATAKVCLVAKLESGHTPSRQHPEYWVPEECTIPWFSLADVWQLRDGRQEYIAEVSENISPLGMANSTAHLMPAGTVVLSRTASVGFSGILTKPMATTQDFANWIPGPRISSEFLLYAFRAMHDEFQRAMMGSTHQTIYMPDIRKLAIPVPSRSEQDRIVGFLRARLPSIDELIAKKERLVELLAEKRQALITQAVTKGLDPNVPMKESGVKWIGRVPAHWSIAALRYLATFQRGHDLPADERRDGTVPVISSAGPIGSHHVAAARGPGIVTGRYGSIGIFYFVAMDYWPLNTALYTNTLHGNSAQFVFNVLSCLRPYFLMESGKSAVPGVDRNDLHVYQVPIPPLREQHAIANKLDDVVSRIVKVEERTRSSIDRLREYRQSVITAAVTGKLDIASALEASS